MSIVISHILCFALGSVVIFWATKSMVDGQFQGTTSSISFASRPFRFCIRGGIYIFFGTIFCLGPRFLARFTEHAWQYKWLITEISALIALSLLSYLLAYAGVRWRAHKEKSP